jgi:hypothetical protein
MLPHRHTASQIDGLVNGPGSPVGYTHNQLSASSQWTINHDLSRNPSVTVVDSSGRVVVGDIQYTSSNQIILTFSAVFAGKAYLN